MIRGVRVARRNRQPWQQLNSEGIAMLTMSAAEDYNRYTNMNICNRNQVYPPVAAIDVTGNRDPTKSKPRSVVIGDIRDPETVRQYYLAALSAEASVVAEALTGAIDLGMETVRNGHTRSGRFVLCGLGSIDFNVQFSKRGSAREHADIQRVQRSLAGIPETITTFSRHRRRMSHDDQPDTV